MGGAFQTSREIFDNALWKDITKFRIFFYIYGNAVFSEKGVQIGNIHIKRGQFLRSYRSLAKDLQYIDRNAVKTYSPSVIQKKVQALVREERLSTVETELGTLFTVVNYSLYQGFEHYKNVGVNGVENDKRTPKEQQENNNNNVKKEKKEKKEKNIYMEFVLLTDEEHQKLIDSLGESKTKDLIERLNNYIGSTGKKYKSHYHTILNWSNKEKKVAAEKNRHPLDKDIELQRWIMDGKDPDEFRWD